MQKVSERFDSVSYDAAVSLLLGADRGDDLVIYPFQLD